MVFIGFYYDNDKVEWRKIKWKNGEETKYSVSNIGLVRNDKTGKTLKSNIRPDGYEDVKLSHKGKQKSLFVHVLVAEAFIPNPYGKKQINHKDGNKSHNYVDNLEWVSQEENIHHAFRTGLNKGNKGKKIKKISDKKIKEICKLLEENNLTIKKIAKTTGVSRQSVMKILNKEIHTNISCNYAISNYSIKKIPPSLKGDEHKNMIYPDSKIREVCELLDTLNYSIRDISTMTNVDYQTVRNVYYGTCRNDISKEYSFGIVRVKGVSPIVMQRKAKIHEVCQLFDKGLNAHEVSKITGIPWSTARCIHSGQSWYDISKDYKFMKDQKKIEINK